MNFEAVMFSLYLYLHRGSNVVKVCGFVDNILLDCVRITSLSSLQCKNSICQICHGNPQQSHVIAGLYSVLGPILYLEIAFHQTKKQLFF